MKRFCDQPSNEELMEAAERADAGLRLAFPQLLDRTEVLPTDDAPVTLVYDRDVIASVAETVARARHDVALELKHLDKNAPRHLHVELLSLVDSHDEYLRMLGEYVGSDS